MLLHEFLFLKTLGTLGHCSQVETRFEFAHLCYAISILVMLNFFIGLCFFTHTTLLQGLPLTIVGSEPPIFTINPYWEPLVTSYNWIFLGDRLSRNGVGDLKGEERLDGSRCHRTTEPARVS